MALIGYARVSTQEQHLDFQYHALRDASCDLIFEDEGYSAVNPNRPGFEDAMKALQQGDIFPVGLANRVCSYSSIFEELVGFLSECIEFPEPDVPDSSNKAGTYTNLEIEEAAESCRKHWALGLYNHIENITNVLENKGVVITSFSGVSEKVDALSLYRKRPIIIRNNAKESPCRLRFDLSHECGHFVLHNGIETGDAVTESEANRFASAFIFPRSAFVKEFPVTLLQAVSHLSIPCIN